MKNNIANIIFLIIIAALFARQCETTIENRAFKKEIETTNRKLIEEKYKNDTLTEVVKGQSRRMVDFSKTVKEMETIIKEKDIELEGREPSTLIEIVTDTVLVEMPIEIYRDSVITYYFPDYKAPFVTHKIDLIKKLSTFSLEPIDILVSLSQDKEGIWYGDVKLPQYLSIKDITIQSTPYTKDTPSAPPRSLKFLAGAEYIYDEKSLSPFVGMEFRSLGIKVGSYSAGLYYKF